MTDAAEQPEPSTVASRLTELQRIDTAADQLKHRHERLAEREALTAATAALAEWERTRTAMRSRLDELDAHIERSEARSAELGEHKERLQAQLKTVIAPREAEALMSEIGGLDAEVDELDLAELEALEEQSAIDDRLTEHLGAEESLRTSVQHADDALVAAAGELETELAGLDAERTAQRSSMADGVLARYDRVRASSGVAVASLSARTCSGCHLDLSAAEIDDVKDEASANDGVADCPNCGRMLTI